MSKSSKVSTEAERIEAFALSFPRPAVALAQIQSKPLGVLRFAVKRALQERLYQLEGDSDIRCLVLTGVDRAFSVGSDIRDFSQEVGWLLENDYIEAGLNAALENSRLPIIAALNGFSLGGGAVLALACDIRIAAESARIGFPEVNVGAFASGSGTQRLPRLVGRGRALDLLFTGRTISAEEALQYGLVEYVVPDDEFLPFVLDYAESIARLSGPVLAVTKRCVTVGLRDGFEAGLAAERQGRVETGRGADALEGRDAFLEKRSPLFNQS
ncbi:MAG: enoyl-CoA hydratase-related protein [Chloroflexota bacterium]|nr:enoyl-CoA hydratase-related protein [Chloroflexota bacterium]